MVKKFSEDIEASIKVFGDVPLKQHWLGEGSALDRKLRLQPKSNQYRICQVLEPIPEEEGSSDTNTYTMMTYN